MMETNFNNENEMHDKRLFSIDELDILGDARLLKLLDTQFSKKSDEIIRLLINFEESNYMILKLTLKQNLHNNKVPMYLEYSNDFAEANKLQIDEALDKLNTRHENFKEFIEMVSVQFKEKGLVAVVSEHSIEQDNYEYTVAINLLQGFTFLTLDKSEILNLLKEGYFTIRELAINKAEPSISLEKLLTRRELVMAQLDGILKELRAQTKSLN